MMIKKNYLHLACKQAPTVSQGYDVKAELEE